MALEVFRRAGLLSRRPVASALLVLGVAAGGLFGSVPGCGSGDSAIPSGATKPPPTETCVAIERAAEGGIFDAEVRSDEPDANRGSSASADVGITAEGASRTLLLRFDLATVPVDATLTSATLDLHSATTTTTGDATIFVHPVTKAWAESAVTFDSISPAIDDQEAMSFSNGGGNFAGKLSVDFLPLVEDWHSGAVKNNGVALAYHADKTPVGSSTYATSEGAIAAQHPLLTVCYLPGEGGPSCFDGIVNQGETGVDCGGPCAPCDLCGGVTCPAPDDCHMAGTCDPATGLCDSPIAADGTSCDDGDGCTQSDVCEAGACIGENPVVCPVADQCHVIAACDPATGVCPGTPLDDGTPCDDGNACTLGDTCEVGLCEGTASPEAQLAGSQVVPGPGDSDGIAIVKLTLDEAAGQACFTRTSSNIAPPTAIGIYQGAFGASGTLVISLPVGQSGCTSGVAGAVIAAIRQDPAGYYVRIDNSEFPSGALRGQFDKLVICVAADECHVVGTCDTSTGVCSDVSVADDSPCDDGDACTQTDSCQGGLCIGTNPVICTALDQCHAMGACDSKSGVCTNPPAADATPCNDGNACTQTDACQAGVCVGASPVVCVAADACHVAGVCDTATGQCDSPAIADGAACDDGDACTQVDTCQAGVCVGASPVVCTALDQCHTAGVCDSATGACSQPNIADGTSCSDGNACTQTDTCQAGTCLGANPVVCTALDQCHVPGTCDSSSGVCSNPNIANNTACNDGNACTQTDSCQAGACVGANPVVCTSLDQCHVPGTCDPNSGVCSNPNAVDGMACDDGNACTQVDTCQSGVCVGASPVVCTALDQCHSPGTCNTATGVCDNPNSANNTACNDGDACTQTDTCQAGSCVGANPVVCTSLDQCHVPGTCNPNSGVCSNPNIADSTACDDGNACTQTDSCQAGACVGANPVVCTSLDQCHVPGTCDPNSGVCSNPSIANNTACNDGDACTQTDTCQAGACVGANPVVCTSLDQCHVPGTCDSSTGVCSNPNIANNTACNDGDACTQTDTCQAGACVGANPVVCTSLDQCHVPGTCDSSSGVCSNPNIANNTACNDGNACTQTDSCQAGACVGANPVVCTSLDQCHVPGTCDPNSGVCSNPNIADSTACNDGDACTQTDTCLAGACVGANPVVCTSLDQCHVPGTCDSSTGVCSNPNIANNTACSDGNACTQTDTCQAGACVGGNPVVCGALDQCHVAGTCDPNSGTCSNPNIADGTVCDDSNICMLSDVCIAGVCAGQVPLSGPCSTGNLGICATGQLACAANTITCVQDFPATTETCNGLDDDCDGVADDGTDPNDANTCAIPVAFSVAPGGLTDLFGTVDADGGDWFLVTFTSVPAPGQYYHPKIDLVDSAGGQYTLAVRQTCGSGLECSMTLDTFEMLYPADPNGCIASGTCSDNVPKINQWYVQVLSKSGQPVCASYHVQVSNI